MGPVRACRRGPCSCARPRRSRPRTRRSRARGGGGARRRGRRRRRRRSRSSSRCRAAVVAQRSRGARGELIVARRRSHRRASLRSHRHGGSRVAALGRSARRTRRTRRADEACGDQDTRDVRRRTGTSEHQSLSKYIQARFDECSRSQKDVAQYIVDHLDEAAFQTAEELARRANTSSSTVVRFSQALGFEGFPELQAAAREEYRRVQRQGGRRTARRRLLDAAVLARPERVRDGARRRPPERRGDRAQGLAQRRSRR